MFHGKIQIFPAMSVVDERFENKMKWLKLKSIFDRKGSKIGLNWRLSDCIRKQLMTPTIRRGMKWFSVVGNDRTKVKYLSYGKCPTDAVAFRSTKRGNVATTYTNCCIPGTAFSHKCADLIGLTNLKEGYINSVLHQRPIDKMIKKQHHIGEM